MDDCSAAEAEDTELEEGNGVEDCCDEEEVDELGWTRDCVETN